MRYEIEKSVPIPAWRSRFPLDKMEVGDSFLVEARDVTAVRSAASLYQAKIGGRFRVLREIENEKWRVWRVK